MVWRSVLGLAMSLWLSVCSAITISFDDIDTSAGDVSLDAYQGLDFSGFFAYGSVPGFPGFDSGIVSPGNAAFTGGEISSGDSIVPVTGSIRGGSLFNFNSAFLGAGFYDNLAITVNGLRDGAVLFSQTVAGNTSAAQQFLFGFTGIDQLTFSSAVSGSPIDPFQCGLFNCTQLTLDDLSIDFIAAPPAPMEVPEPSAAGLVLLGIAVLAGARRLRRALPPASV